MKQKNTHTHKTEISGCLLPNDDNCYLSEDKKEETWDPGATEII